MSFTNGVRRQSEWQPETPPFMSNGIGNLYKEQENVIPNVMTSPGALLPDSSNHEDQNIKINGCCSSAKKTCVFEDDTLSDKSCTSNELPTPPDGGWGWAVVFASFMIHIIADGITYSFGIFVVALMEGFKGTTRASVSFIPSILVGVTLGVGPIASSLTNRFGCRVVTIIGALIAAAGLASSAAATNIITLYCTVGLCTGIGFGLIYLPAIVSVSMYFEKRRAFATGIAVCGSGVGTFIMAPVTRILIDNFGWDKAFLIIGAIVLLCVIFGALFRPLDSPSNISETTSNTTSNQDVLNVDDEKSSIFKMPYQLEQEKSISVNHSFAIGPHIDGNDSFINNYHNNTINSPDIKLNGDPLGQIGLPFGQTANGLLNSNGVPDGKYSDVARMALSHPVLPSEPPIRICNHAYGSQSKIYEKRTVIPQTYQTGALFKSTRRCHHNSGVMFRKDILYGGSLYNIPEYKTNPRRYSRHLSAMQDEERRALAAAAKRGQDKDQDKICGCIPASGTASKAFKQMMDFSLLKDGIFIMFAFSNFLTSIGFNVPYVYLVDRAEEQFKFNKEDASLLLSVVGIANTLGRIVLGYISDRGWIKRLYLYNICLIICGISMGLSNFCTDYNMQRIFCAVFGITSGAYVGLTSVVLVDLLGLDKLTNAFGLLLLFQGIASVMGPPIIGWLYDAVGSYDAGFYFAGAMIFLSGFMLFAIPWLERKRDAETIATVEEQYADLEGRIVEVDEEDPEDEPMTMKAKPVN